MGVFLSICIDDKSYLLICVLNHPCISGIKHTWFIMTYVWTFYMFLYLFCMYFIENFWSYILKGNWSLILFGLFFVCIEYQGNCDFINELGITPYVSIFRIVCKTLALIFKRVVEFCTEYVWPWAFFWLVGRILITVSID